MNGMIHVQCFNYFAELPDIPYSREDVADFLSNLKMHYRQIVDEADKTKVSSPQSKH